MKRRSALLGCALLSLSATAWGQEGYEPANSLPWPLWHQEDPSIPREALGNAFGEYQEFGEFFLHSGIDIRGRDGDVVKLVAGGNIWMTIDYMADRCSAATTCRIYVRGTDDRYVYYYSHLQLHAESDITAETRAKIIAATHWNPATGDMTEQPGTDVSAGTVLSRIGPFSNNWPHLHFAVVDSTQNWDAVNPLTALSRSVGGLSIIDDERPEITALELVRDGLGSPLTVPDACTPIFGPVDIAATMRDSFYTTDPVPAPVQGDILSTFGVYEAEYRVRRVDTGASLSGTWYRMDRVPLECAGPARGTACPVSMTLDDFARHSFRVPSSGIQIAQPYTPTLFATTPSTSDYLGLEEYVHLLTNTWGQDGRWDTAATGDGWYQVSAIAKDLDGNQQARSRFVTVQNGATPVVLPGEVYVRDNPNDVGAIPSTLGGHPFWTSPDIFVMPSGVVPGLGDTPPETLLEPDTAYDVYVRVKNDSCTDVPAVGVQVYSANPSMIVDTSQWVHITPEGTYQPTGGTSVPRGASVLFGPFPWTPTADEAASNLGHRCMLAKIDAAADPVGTADVPDNDNIAQRNLQFGLTSFSFGNSGSKLAKIGTEMRCNGFPVGENGALLELRVPYHQALYNAWLGTPGTVVTSAGGQIVVRFTRCNVRLPGVDLKAFEVLPGASFKAVAPPKPSGTWTIDLSQTANGVLGGGMSFQVESP